MGGRAEAIRMMLNHANVSFEDKRISMEEWPALKATGASPMGGLPFWTEDGGAMAQCNAILRMHGIRHGYYSTDPMICYNIDSLCDWIEDFCEGIWKNIFARMEGGTPGDEDVLGYYDKKLPLIEARL